MPLDYPLWLRAAHFFNFLLLSLLVRSGLEILSAHPRLYWNDHCTPGSEWLKFTKKQRPVALPRPGRSIQPPSTWDRGVALISILRRGHWALRCTFSFLARAGALPRLHFRYRHRSVINRNMLGRLQICCLQGSRSARRASQRSKSEIPVYVHNCTDLSCDLAYGEIYARTC
jgi:hypothetical protein